MGKLALGVGILGTLVAAGSCNEGNKLEDEIYKLSNKEIPAFYNEYEHIQYQLSDYAVDNTLLWKMDSTKAQAMIDQINQSLNKRSELIAKRDSITENYDIKGYEKIESENNEKIEELRKKNTSYNLFSMFGSMFGFVGYVFALGDYSSNRRRKR